MTKPFFSIVVPTKNRAKYLKILFLSMEKQSFDSYELIIIDNDDTEETRKICGEFHSPKIKYLRTGSLNMFDNWNFAASQANGEWVIFLEDKQALYPDSLKVIADTINANNINTALVFDGDFYNDVQFEEGGIVSEKKYSNKLIRINSTKLLGDYERNLLATSPAPGVSESLPKPQNSAVKLELFIATKTKFGAYFLFGALDFSSALAKLLLSDHIYRIDLGLFMVTTLKVSNGLSTAIYREKAHKDNIAIADQEYADQLSKLPFPEISMTNVFLIDYLVIRKKFNKNFNFKINNVNYFKCIFKDIYNIHAVMRKVALKNSLRYYMHCLSKAEIKLTGKISIYLFILKHYFHINFFMIALNIKHHIDSILVKKVRLYADPIEFISNKNFRIKEYK